MGIIFSQSEHLWPIVYQWWLKVATAFVAILLLLKNWIGSQIGQLANWPLGGIVRQRKNVPLVLTYDKSMYLTFLLLLLQFPTVDRAVSSVLVQNSDAVWTKGKLSFYIYSLTCSTAVEMLFSPSHWRIVAQKAPNILWFLEEKVRFRYGSFWLTLSYRPKAVESVKNYCVSWFARVENMSKKASAIECESKR